MGSGLGVEEEQDFGDKDSVPYSPCWVDMHLPIQLLLLCPFLTCLSPEDCSDVYLYRTELSPPPFLPPPTSPTPPLGKLPPSLA